MIAKLQFIIRIVILSIICLIPLTACRNDDNTKSPETGRQTTIADRNAPYEKKSSVTGTKSSSRPPSGSKTNSVSADSRSTDTAIVISGTIQYEDGQKVTTGTVISMSANRSVGSGMTLVQSNPVPISSDGKYEIQCDPENNATLLIQGEFPKTYEHISRNRSTNGSTRKISHDITVPRGVEVRGKVIDNQNNPVANASVTLRSVASQNHGSASSEASTSSTANGEFILPYVRAGKNKAFATHPDLVNGVTDATIPTSEPLTITMLKDGATVTGHVYRQETGTPQPNVKVKVTEAVTYQLKEAITQSDGSFRIDKIRPGQATIIAGLDEPRLGMYPGQNLRLQTFADNETTNVTVLVYEGHKVSGRVYDKETGDPVNLATISTYDSYKVTTSGEDGKFNLSSLFPGSELSPVQLRVQKEGYVFVGERHYEPDILNLPVTLDSLTVETEIPMVKTVLVKGIVKSNEQIPIPNATIELKDQNSNSTKKKSVTTKADGTFEVEVRPFYDASVKATATGFAPGFSQPFHVDNSDIDNVEVILEVGATVQGTVVGPDEKPVPKANVGTYTMVQIGNYGMGESVGDTKTNESGGFTLSNLPRKSTLNASHKEFASPGSQELELTPGELRSNVIIKLETGHKISGIVVDSQDKPVKGAWVHAINGGSSSKTTEEDGKFELNNLREGTYSLQASGGGGNAKAADIKTGTTDVVLRFSEAEKRDKTNLIGTLVDETTNEPIVTFQINNLGNVKPDPNRKGGFSVDGLVQGVTYSAEVRATGYPKSSVSIEVPKGQTTFEKTFKIGKGGAITGIVVDGATKKPIPGLLVINWGKIQDSYNRAQGMPESSVTTDADGKFVLAPAPAGENSFIVRPQAPLVEISQKVKVANDEIADVGTIELAAGGSIFGKVTRGNGKEPVANTTVVAYAYNNETGNVRKTATTDNEGSYRIEGLSAQTYQVSVQSFSVSRSAEVSLGGEKEVNINMGGITVTGKVTKGGNPVQCSISAGKTSGDLTVATSTNGTPYKLTGLTPGEWKFSVYVFGDNNSGRSHEETITIPDRDEFEKDFQLPDVRITGIVIDPAGEPAPNVTVQLSQKQTSAGGGDGWRGGYNASTRTSSEGRFTFSGMQEGTYQVSASKENVGVAMEPSVQAKDGKPSDLRLQLDANGGTLVSVALNMADGSSLPAAWCYLYGSNGRFTHSATRNANGVMTITNIPPGQYTSNVSTWGFSQSEKSVEIKAGETVTIEDVLYAAGALEWSLAKADGSPATATGTATPMDPGSFEQPQNVSTAAGKLVVRGLAPGNYQVTAQAAGKPSVTETFTVIAGDVARKSTTVPTW